MNHQRQGRGTPLVLIHGVGSRWQIWGPMLDRLARSHDVIAVDLPGFGASAPSGKPSSILGLADQLVDFLSELGVERPHLAGNSMGGGIAMELGKRGLARSVTAFSPIGYWSTAELLWTQQALRASRAAAKAFHPVIGHTLGLAPARAAIFGHIYGKPWAYDPEYLRADAAALVGATGFEEALSSFADFTPPTAEQLAGVPTTIAWGSRDVLLVYRTQSNRAKRALPDARHVTLSGCGHLPFADDSVLCSDVLLDTTGADG